MQRQPHFKTKQVSVWVRIKKKLTTEAIILRRLNSGDFAGGALDHWWTSYSSLSYVVIQWEYSALLQLISGWKVTTAFLYNRRH